MVSPPYTFPTQSAYLYWLRITCPPRLFRKYFG